VRWASYCWSFHSVQIRIDSWNSAKARKLIGPLRALERTGEHLHEAQTLLSHSQTSRVLFSLIRERNLGSPGVLAGDAPSRFFVTDKKKIRVHRCLLGYRRKNAPFDHRDLHGVVDAEARDHGINKYRERLPPRQ
jgi:hypothetical protein